jgi:uncharacterized RDD family membrane protein YckC
MTLELPCPPGPVPSRTIGLATASGILPSMAAEPDGVYFAAKDYAHPLRRLAALVIDLAFLFAMLNVIFIPLAYVMVPETLRSQRRTAETQREMQSYVKPIKVPVTLAWLALCVAYEIPLRRTRGGTVGYRLTGIRLVDQSGQAPQMRPLIRRLLFAIPCTLFLGVSYFSCFTSPRRQTAHDKWSGTWAVRKAAQPAGPALTSYHTTFLGTIPMTYVDLEPQPGESPSASNESSVAVASAAADEAVARAAHL